MANSIPGNVTISGTGVLELDNNIAMSSISTLTLAGAPSAGTVNLNFAGTQTIGVLIFGSTAKPAGTYGANGSTAIHQSAVFTGTGILSVTGQAYWDPGFSGRRPRERWQWKLGRNDIRLVYRERRDQLGNGRSGDFRGNGWNGDAGSQRERRRTHLHHGWLYDNQHGRSLRPHLGRK